MSRSVTVIDYGCGNLLSVTRALGHCGGEPLVTNDPDQIANADRLVLPGVGAFGNAMDELRQLKLVDAIKAFASTGRPFLGICLGMQLMFESSTELGTNEGLGLLSGAVSPVPATGVDGKEHKIPHIGWAPIFLPNSSGSFRDVILGDIESGDCVYFVHSFAVTPGNDTDVLAVCEYNGRQITATVERDRLYGCQFHPEKSGMTGLKILTNFLSIPFQTANASGATTWNEERKASRRI